MSDLAITHYKCGTCGEYYAPKDDDRMRNECRTCRRKRCGGCGVAIPDPGPGMCAACDECAP